MPKGTHPVEKFIEMYAGPFGYVRKCAICGFYTFRKKGGGRAAGFRYGNKQRGVIIQHIKQAHPAVYAAAMSARQ